MNEAVILSKKIRDTECDIFRTIGEIVQTKLNELSNSTGVSINSIDIELITKHSLGTNAVDYIVHDVRIGVGLPSC